MNEDYLWDKSGEPDPEIQQLEEILGTLRYQPKPFEAPRDVAAPRRRSYFPLLAIAATLLVALLAGGIWLRVRTGHEPQPQYVQVPAPRVEEKPIVQQPEKRQAAPKQSLAVNRVPRKRSSAPVLSKREREEALAAKQQLMLALRVASEKLNLVHKRTQSTSPSNQIKNQHRIG
ncbi:MAG TPA: hypothetical protein VFB70_07475 [Pyrinomonadaceae bacterium]|nr:hypothetical protein [Pyrinomonadaceae bacterium]